MELQIFYFAKQFIQNRAFKGIKFWNKEKRQMKVLVVGPMAVLLCPQKLSTRPRGAGN
jgi:hypothetical protein